MWAVKSSKVKSENVKQTINSKQQTTNTQVTQVTSQ